MRHYLDDKFFPGALFTMSLTEATSFWRQNDDGIQKFHDGELVMIVSVKMQTNKGMPEIRRRRVTFVKCATGIACVAEGGAGMVYGFFRPA